MGPQSTRRTGANGGNRSWPTIGRMTSLGSALSSEERMPKQLVEHAVRAVRAEHHGFGLALISDHVHPWIDRQGQGSYGPDRDRFLDFAARSLLPELVREPASVAS